jgi:hypothetical protein
MTITAEQLRQIIIDNEPGSNHSFYHVVMDEGASLPDLRIIADKLNEFFNGAGAEASARV